MKSIIILHFILFVTCAAEISKSGVKFSDPVAFVRSIELAESKSNVPGWLLDRTPVQLGLPPNNKTEGYVIAGAIVTFTQNVTGLAKQDVIDSTLFAQIAASQQYNRESDPDNWYKYYAFVLENLGYVIQDFQFKKYTPKKDVFKKHYFSMDTVVMEELDITEEQKVVMNKTLLELNGTSVNNSTLQLFYNQSTNGSKGNFQIFLCENNTGNVSLALGAFHFTTNNSNVDANNYLFKEWKDSSHDITIFEATQMVYINESIYGTVRDEVSILISNYATKLVASIQLKN